MVKYLPDYYKILNINTDANNKEIKIAYTKMSKKYNSKNNVIKGLVNDAYIVLSDTKKRKTYDKLRKDVLQNKKKTNEKKNSLKDTVKTVNDVKDKYDLLSKLFKVGSGTMKGKSLFTGTNLIIGGAMAGYGLKKGRDYMAKRGKK